ncbi:glutaminase domain-containing protein [Gaoshiqia sp. Z1-71]|uniref:glutaminase domain-containing protein n=1 Tax=Gaoshiqia hydrogeniformans TaxID=3290090 RepID=UPI003BF91FD6
MSSIKNLNFLSGIFSVTSFIIPTRLFPNLQKSFYAHTLFHFFSAQFLPDGVVSGTAALSNDQETFQKLIHPLHRFMNETTDRVPMTDWYHTDSKRQAGFRARSVVGGYYIRLLEERLR